ncbi:MAG: LptF/LptG family permease [Muribaculaceae bacterium]
MLKIKRLHTFVLQTFLPLFFMTFFICLFILLMQFLWHRIDELVGKGLSVDVISEMFFYAALSFVPMALPLAILLASLMTFGNLGEHSELTAIKASGVSLLKVMQPLIVFIGFVAVVAFFFQNEVLPRAQVKMWTIVFSVRQKSPDLEIPEGSFYDQIPGYNVFVKHKNRNTGTLYDMMIYDVSKGYGYANVILADSGKLSFDEGKTHLFLNLYSGESFQDMRDTRSNVGSSDEGKLYRRESFHDKQILIPFDANFNKLDEQTMRSQYIGKNIKELRHTIDSVNSRLDSISGGIMQSYRLSSVVGIPSVHYTFHDTTKVIDKVELPKLKRAFNIDSFRNAMPVDKQSEMVKMAMSKASRAQQDFLFQGVEVADDVMTIRRHEIELIRKYTLSLACLIFFFIGAPLGAIIRKGGLGTPIVISVLLFIVYYIIDNFGFKQARDGRFDVWLGIWLSSIALFPLGVFLTYKAMNDSAVFNPDAYRNLVRRLLGIQEARKIVKKELIIDEVNGAVAVEKLHALKAAVDSFVARYRHRQMYLTYLCKGYDRHAIDDIITQLEGVVDYLSNSRSQLVINKAMDFPILRNSWIYGANANKRIGLALAVLVPVGLPLYLIGASNQKTFKNELKTVSRVCDQMIALIEEEK